MKMIAPLRNLVTYLILYNHVLNTIITEIQMIKDHM